MTGVLSAMADLQTRISNGRANANRARDEGEFMRVQVHATLTLAEAVIMVGCLIAEAIEKDQ